MADRGYVNIKIPVEIYESLVASKRAGVSWGAHIAMYQDRNGQVVCPHCRIMRPIMPCPRCESHRNHGGGDEFREAVAGKPALSIVSSDHGTGGG